MSMYKNRSKDSTFQKECPYSMKRHGSWEMIYIIMITGFRVSFYFCLELKLPNKIYLDKMCNKILESLKVNLWGL